MNRKQDIATKKELCFQIYQAFVQIRFLISTGRSEQAADLADVYHNLPVEMWRKEFDVERFRASLSAYLQKYSEDYSSGNDLAADCTFSDSAEK